MSSRSNYSHLEENTLAGLSEAGGILYLKLVEKYNGNETKAFLAAHKYDNTCGEVLSHILKNGPTFESYPEEVRKNLLTFLTERYRNNFM